MAVWMYLKHVQTNQRQSLVFFAVTDHTWLDTWTIAVLPGVEVFNCIPTHQKDCTEQKQFRSCVVLSPWWNTSMDKLEQPSGLALPCLKANSLHRTIHPTLSNPAQCTYSPGTHLWNSSPSPGHWMTSSRTFCWHSSPYSTLSPCFRQGDSRTALQAESCRYNHTAIMHDIGIIHTLFSRLVFSTSCISADIYRFSSLSFLLIYMILCISLIFLNNSSLPK